MENILHLAELKTKLQSFGALRPEAWERILQLCQQTEVKTGESLIRKQGTLAYIAQGLLKEYNAQHRTQPAIINFNGPKQSIITRKHNQSHYLKAANPSLVYYWDFEDLQKLYQEFKELKAIYDALIAEYDELLLFRMHLLELPVQKRIDTFRLIFKPMLPYLKKKDMANYLHLNYSFFVNQTNKRS